MSLKGDTGQDVETIMNDKVVVVGDHPNLNPSVHTEPTGYELNNYSVSKSAGCMQTKSAIPCNTPIDNAGDFHGGTCTYTVMNSLHFEVANGGVSIDSGGNISIASWGGILSLTATTEVGINAELLKITALDTCMISGTTLYVDAKEVIMDSTVKFGKNILVNGGIGVNGELVASHITTPLQLNFTEECDELLVYPMMGATVDVVLIPTSNPLLAGTCKIMLTPTMQNPIGFVPPHDHIFEGPACSLVEDLTEFHSEMAKSESNEPMEAKPAMPLDMGISELGKKITGRIQDRIVTAVKAMFGF